MLRVSRVEKIRGTIAVPGDKSISHRAVMIAGISKGESIIKGFLRGEDCLSTVACCRNLGVEITEEGDLIKVRGNGLFGLKEPEDVLDAGNSGTTMRLLSGILAGQDFLSVLTGDASLRKRPMGRIAIPLREMGAQIDGRGGGQLAPLVIRGGNLQGIEYSLPVPSAQVKSAILLAGLYASGITQVREEIPSRDHTERMLSYFGGNVKTESGSITISKSELYARDVEVPGDISSAAFFIAAAAAMPGSHLIIKNIGLNPTRRGIVDILLKMGADLHIEQIRINSGEEVGNIHIRGKKLHGVTVKENMIPSLIDEIPVLAAIAAVAEGKTVITGAGELKVKESNRIEAMVNEMRKLGVKIQELPDGMEIEGPNRIIGGTVESYGDHRIAMALAVCGLFADGDVSVANSDCITISFPQFAEILTEITS